MEGVTHNTWTAIVGQQAAKVWRGWQAFQEFVRFGAFGLSALMPLIGSATVAGRISGYHIAGLIGVAFAYHCFGYVLNDVVDLPVDRRQRGRTRSPLVRGVIRPWQALLFAFLQIPLAFVLNAWLDGGLRAMIVLGAGFVLTAVYDLWGKRTQLPPLTDMAQGLAWAALILYGAVVTPGPLTNLTWIVCGYMAFFILQVNGVHASLRDLGNDVACGMRTTAILLGAQPSGETGFILTRRLLIYTFTLQAILAALLLLPLLRNDPAYAPAVRRILLIAMLMIAALCLRLLAIMLQSGDERRAFVSTTAFYIVLSLAALVVLLGPQLDQKVLITMLVVGFAPLMLNAWWYKMLRWGWQQSHQLFRH